MARGDADAAMRLLHDLTQPRFRDGRGDCPRDHPVDAERRRDQRLVVDAVLQRQHRRDPDPGAGQFLQGGRGVERLQREHQDVPARGREGSPGLGEQAHVSYPARPRTRRDAQTPFGDRLGRARLLDEAHLVPRRGEGAADIGPQGSGAQEAELHGVSLVKQTRSLGSFPRSRRGAHRRIPGGTCARTPAAPALRGGRPMAHVAGSVLRQMRGILPVGEVSWSLYWLITVEGVEAG